MIKVADEDKLLGIAKTGRGTAYTYSAYRIDYDSQLSITELGEDAGLIGDDQVASDYFTGATKNPPHGYQGHEAKTDYQRKVLVEDATTRDEVQAVLNDAGASYTTEDVSPTDAEKAHIKDYGAENSLDVPFALRWMRSLTALDGGNITEAQFERWNNENTDLSEAPDLSVDDGSLTNDGTETETVTVSHSFNTEQEAVLIVGETSFSVTLTPGENYTESVTTTKSAGTSITVSLVGNFLGPNPVEIEVTN